MEMTAQEREHAMAQMKLGVVELFYIPSTAFMKYLKAPLSRGVAEMSNRIADEYDLPKIDMNDPEITWRDDPPNASKL